MLDRIKYVNSVNEEIDFGTDGIYISSNDFRNYEWSYNSRYSKIIGFQTKIAKKKLPVTIEGEDANEIANRIFEVIDKDIRNSKPGKVIINDYEMKGYFFASEKKRYLQKGIVKFDLSFVSDNPSWKKESAPYHFNVQETAAKGLDYNHDFAYDFTSTLYTAQLANPNYTGTDFKLFICGPTVNPIVQIGENTYSVAVNIEVNEYLVIDSVEKTVKVVKADGSTSNAFGSRDKDYNIFAPIAPGANNVSWGSDFSFDVVLIEMRSEPRWN